MIDPGRGASPAHAALWQIKTTLAAASPRSATLQIGRLIDREPEPTPRLHLAQALLKGAAMDAVVQKATELGATDLWLIRAERSNLPTDPERLARKQEHWQRVIENAAEQCGALHLPRLHDVRTLGELLATPPVPTLIMLDPAGEPLPLSLPRAPAVIMIGPEGGWSDAERQCAAEAAAICHGLGRRVLRAETAPLAALAALRHGWGWE